MVDSPPDWDGKGFTCPACGGDVIAAGAPASGEPEPSAGSVPEGLEVKQTPEGRFRIEYRWGSPLLQVAQGLISVGVLGHMIYLSARRFTQGGGSDKFIWFLAAEALVFLLLARSALRSAFGRHAIEFDAGGVTKCFRLPPLPERRTLYRAEEITALKVTTFERAKPGDRSPRWLQVNMGTRERPLVTGIPVEQLEWMRERIAAVVGIQGQEAQG
jgi:hypothetical protein